MTFQLKCLIVLGSSVAQYSDQATDWTTGIPFPAVEMMGFFSPYHRVQTSSEACPVSY